MISSIAILFLAILLFLVLASGIVVLYALRRHSLEEWQSHLRHQRELGTSLDLPEAEAPGDQTVTLESLLSTDATDAGYLEAEMIPGNDKVMEYSQRLDDFSARRHEKTSE